MGYREQKNFYRGARDDLVYSFCFKDDAINYVYENKINFCSGYFPDYILYPCVNIDNVEPDLRLFLDYYPTFSEGKYSKQISNKYSRYNKQYFAEQYSICKICEKFQKIQEASPSCRIVANSSRIGTNGDSTNKSQSEYSYEFEYKPINNNNNKNNSNSKNNYMNNTSNVNNKINSNNIKYSNSSESKGNSNNCK